MRSIHSQAPALWQNKVPPCRTTKCRSVLLLSCPRSAKTSDNALCRSCVFGGHFSRAKNNLKNDQKSLRLDFFFFLIIARPPHSYKFSHCHALPCLIFMLHFENQGLICSITQAPCRSKTMVTVTRSHQYQREMSTATVPNCDLASQERRRSRERSTHKARKDTPASAATRHRSILTYHSSAFL